MIFADNISLAYGKRVLFKDVNIMFKPGNCYGLIGANGAGKSTFLKILANEIEPDTGTVAVGPKERIAVLRQDHFAFDDHTVLDTIIMGYEKLYRLMAERVITSYSIHYTKLYEKKRARKRIRASASSLRIWPRSRNLASIPSRIASASAARPCA